MIVRLQTADHIRLASTVQETQCTMATFDRTRVMRLAMGDAHDAIAPRFQHGGWGIFSALLRFPEQGFEPMRHCAPPSLQRLV